MTDLSAHFPLLVADEFPLLQLLAPSTGADILDVGCGAGAVTARLAGEGGAHRVIGADVDDAQLAKNAAKTWPANVEFVRSGLQELPFADASFDGLTLMKSLHHVPVALMDPSFAQMHRVLRPGGWVYISEPVYDGPYNDVMKLFHDEGVVRAQALQATERAVASGKFSLKRRVMFYTTVSYKSFDDFYTRQMRPTHSEIALSPELVDTVREAYSRHQTPAGASFVRPGRIDLLVRN